MAIFNPTPALPSEGTVMITVNDIVQRALPAQSTVVAGFVGLGREVNWATRLRPAPPAFAHLSGGEIVLLPPNVLELLDERLTLDEAIRQLAGFGVAAVAFAGRITDQALAAADATGVPLIQLPGNVDFGSLEREASRYIAERRREIQRLGQEAGRQLMELAIAGEPLSVLAQELAALSDRSVVFESREGRLLAFHAPPAAGTSVDAQLAQTLLAETRDSVAGWLRSVAATSLAEPPTATYAANDSWLRVVAPISGREGLLGSASLIVRPGTETIEDSLFASRAAAACAVLLSREQAAAGARREIELNVLDEILDGALRSEVSLLQQAQRLGHDLTKLHVALIARVDSAPGAPARARDGRWSVLEEGLNRAARSLHARILWRVRNTSAEIVWPIEDEAHLESVVRAVSDDLNAAVAIQTSSEVVSLGVGRPQLGIEGIRRSHQEARQALTLGRRVQGAGHVTSFEQLGIYRLIFAAEPLPELRLFLDEALGSLIHYDQVHGAELIKTLEAFFAANCSPKEAASLLHVHRNTVLYRLDRIGEITKLDLNAADVRLRLHLALHVRLALSA
jgi:purine catabolism regulator